ncbi:ankyrin repeat domain-containing protein SOWAHA [Hetaerina americana]|uniref:ankyrin repeat domain-containing protein SOWAHA n=1 Tax=Hetaerina americana TaxID=62018 RepID=UPI003A7F5FFA
MAAPTEFSLEAVRKFMIEKGGKVTNHELVKHFKNYLTNPESKVEARTIFKEYVNTLASIKNEEGEKHLVLKSKYRPYELLDTAGLSSPSSMASNETTPTSPSPSPVVTGSSSHLPLEVLDFTSPARQPPPYRPPPPPISPPKSAPIPPPNYSSLSVSQTSGLSTLHEGSVVSLVQMPQESGESFKPVLRSEEISDLSNKLPQETDPPPPVPPRRRSNDRGRIDNKENLPESIRKLSSDDQHDDQKPEKPVSEVDGEQKISVKERMQKFNRLASESDLLLLQPQAAKKKVADRGVVDDDRVSVTSLTPKSKEWLVRAAQGNYQDLAKLASEDSTLPRVKDPTSNSEKQGISVSYCVFENGYFVKLRVMIPRHPPTYRTSQK